MLAVWLPLINGNRDNLGLINIGTATTSASIVSGKLGNCYLFTRTSHHLLIYTLPTELLNKINNHSFGVSAWVKSSSSNAGVWLSITYGIRFECNSFFLYNSSRSVGASASSGTAADGNWHHVAYTYNVSTNKMTCYRDGVEVGSANYTSGYTYASSWTNNINIARDPNNSPDSYYFNGCIQDVRIWADECPTLQHIKEISKGLVAHYTLGSASLASSGNLINGLAGGGLCTVSGNSINISGTNSDTYFYIKTTKAMTSGKLYRLSCIGSGFPASTLYNFPIAGQSNTGPGQIKIKNGPCMLTFVANDACANAGTNIIMDDTSRTAGAGTISGLCLEEISSVSDSSGYSRNLTITGNVSPADSVRYDKSLRMQADNNKCESSTNFVSNLTNCTVSWWYKPVNIRSTVLIMGQDGSHYIAAYNSGSFYNNEAGQTAKLYIDGVEKAITRHDSNVDTHYNATLTSGWHHYCLTGLNLSTWTKFRIGGYGSSWKIDGDTSDVRLYATALSADDVKDLYNLGALIS